MTPEALAERVARICGERVGKVVRFAGGDISGASRATLSNGRTVVAKSGPMVEREARMLGALYESGAPVPAILGTADGILVMEDLGEGAPLEERHWVALAQALEPLRNVGQPSYGWHEDYSLRDVAVDNGGSNDWVRFWTEKRLLCHLPVLPTDLARRVERLAKKLSDIIPATPKPSLVHGDLWGGNVFAQRDGKVWLIDPCAYYGDREVDAACLTVFDRPPDSFFEVLELDPGWRERQPAYRLWLWLVHIRLFGESYRPAAERDLSALGF